MVDIQAAALEVSWETSNERRAVLELPVASRNAETARRWHELID